jgi:hypothetical protein
LHLGVGFFGKLGQVLLAPQFKVWHFVVSYFRSAFVSAILKRRAASILHTATA